MHSWSGWLTFSPIILRVCDVMRCDCSACVFRSVCKIVFRFESVTLSLPLYSHPEKKGDRRKCVHNISIELKKVIFYGLVILYAPNISYEKFSYFCLSPSHLNA